MIIRAKKYAKAYDDFVSQSRHTYNAFNLRYFCAQTLITCAFSMQDNLLKCSSRKTNENKKTMLLVFFISVFGLIE